MLKLVGKDKPAPPPPAEPEPTVPVEAEAPSELPEQDMAMPDGPRVTPEQARYFGPECRCETCAHFDGASGCELVAGPIEPDAVCSLHTCDHEEQAPMPEDGGAPPVAEPPVM